MNDSLFSSSGAQAMAFMEDYMARGGKLAEASNISVEAQEALYELAYLKYNNALYEKSARLFQFLCLYDQWNPCFFTGLGACQQMVGLYGEAIDTYLYVLSLDANDPHPMIYVGDCYVALGQHQKARLAYQASVLMANASGMASADVSRVEKIINEC
ncbi:SycD/LcrH family type III secretion system chaperone [Endozoicomonas sp. SESOKO1]|uniref:SycD/LcrH family type III secretion system chaperone n=1 Tax=Endozoicomonas sp. SESOKO1 TaxID=2828742 RepID=UPI002148AC44|nr:SycD/LcrH family type III secretion system chaperone [Endozoicomonas sp. SESOKO1]